MYKLRPLTEITHSFVKGNFDLSKKRLISHTGTLCTDKKSDPNHPIQRTLNIFRRDWQSLKDYLARLKNNDDLKEFAVPLDQFQTHCDVLVIGGGSVGSSIAYWLKKNARDGLNVVVVEKDFSYSKTSAIQSFHGMHQNFSVPENIQMAIYSTDFMRAEKKNLGDVHLNFVPYGSLKLANEESADQLLKSARTQRELGIRNELLSPEKLQLKFPWLNTKDIVLGCHGLEREGWFDPLALLLGYQRKALEYGAHFVDGEIVGFEFKDLSNVILESENSNTNQSLEKAIVQMPDGERRSIKFALCVIAAGSNSAEVGKLANIGKGPGILTIPLPVEPRKNFTCRFSSQNSQIPILSSPFTIDPNGLYFRREGLSGNYVCGTSNLSLENDFTDSQNVFETKIKPILANRVEKFSNAKLQACWVNECEHNTYDESGVLGTHPFYNNLYLATGFSRQGIQQTPAIGRAISELIIDGRFRTIDLTRLSFDRLVVNQPLHETSI